MPRNRAAQLKPQNGFKSNLETIYFLLSCIVRVKLPLGINDCSVYVCERLDAEVESTVCVLAIK